MKCTMTYFLYAAGTRRELSPCVENYVDKASSLGDLRTTEDWKTKPCIITDISRKILDSNQIDLAHK